MSKFSHEKFQWQGKWWGGGWVTVGVSHTRSHINARVPIRSLPLGVSMSTKPDPGKLLSGHCHGPL